MGEAERDIADALGTLEKTHAALEERLGAEPAWQALKQLAERERAGEINGEVAAGDMRRQLEARLDASVPDWRRIEALASALAMLKAANVDAILAAETDAGRAEASREPSETPKPVRASVQSGTGMQGGEPRALDRSARSGRQSAGARVPASTDRPVVPFESTIDARNKSLVAALGAIQNAANDETLVRPSAARTGAPLPEVSADVNEILKRIRSVAPVKTEAGAAPKQMGIGPNEDRTTVSRSTPVEDRLPAKVGPGPAASDQKPRGLSERLSSAEEQGDGRPRGGAVSAGARGADGGPEAAGKPAVAGSDPGPAQVTGAKRNDGDVGTAGRQTEGIGTQFRQTKPAAAVDGKQPDAGRSVISRPTSGGAAHELPEATRHYTPELRDDLVEEAEVEIVLTDEGSERATPSNATGVSGSDPTAGSADADPWFGDGGNTASAFERDDYAAYYEHVDEASVEIVKLDQSSPPRASSRPPVPPRRKW